MGPPSSGPDWIAISSETLPIERATSWATTPRSGAVVCFSGVVRDHAEGRCGVSALTYEAYEEQALRRLEVLAADARRRWPDLERLVMLHRVGRLALGETSVVVVASTPHRSDAFEAARFCIDTLKQTVPIWKQEHWDGGSGWSEAASLIRPVGEHGPA